jgi:hypothetical protein
MTDQTLLASEKTGLSDDESYLRANVDFTNHVNSEVLSSSAKTERDKLLVASIVTAATTSLANITKISVSGIEITTTTKALLPGIMTAVLLYLICTFVSVVWLDRRRWLEMSASLRRPLTIFQNRAFSRMQEAHRRAEEQRNIINIAKLENEQALNGQKSIVDEWKSRAAEIEKHEGYYKSITANVEANTEENKRNALQATLDAEISAKTRILDNITEEERLAEQEYASLSPMNPFTSPQFVIQTGIFIMTPLIIALGVLCAAVLSLWNLFAGVIPE